MRWFTLYGFLVEISNRKHTRQNFFYNFNKLFQILFFDPFSHPFLHMFPNNSLITLISIRSHSWRVFSNIKKIIHYFQLRGKNVRILLMRRFSIALIICVKQLIMIKNTMNFSSTGGIAFEKCSNLVNYWIILKDMTQIIGNYLEFMFGWNAILLKYGIFLKKYILFRIEFLNSILLQIYFECNFVGFKIWFHCTAIKICS